MEFGAVGRTVVSCNQPRWTLLQEEGGVSPYFLSKLVAGVSVGQKSHFNNSSAAGAVASVFSDGIYRKVLSNG